MRPCRANADRGIKKGWWRTKKGKSFSFLALSDSPAPSYQDYLQMFHNPLRRPAVPQGRDRAFLPVPAIKRASVN